MMSGVRTPNIDPASRLPQPGFHTTAGYCQTLAASLPQAVSAAGRATHLLSLLLSRNVPVAATTVIWGDLIMVSIRFSS